MPVTADEGGVRYWLPGNFGSFAATPSEPGWALPVVYHSMSADASGSRSFPVAGRITAGLNADGDLVFVVPTYSFENPVAGGQAAVTMAVAYGRIGAVIDATLTNVQQRAQGPLPSLRMRPVCGSHRARAAPVL